MLRNLKIKILSWAGGFFIGILLGILLGIIGITIFKGLTSTLSMEQLTMSTVLSTTIMAFATVILVGITGFYAFSTYKILKEQEKLRTIAKIENKILSFESQLQNFYYPLDNFMKRYFTFRENSTNQECSLQVSGVLHNTKTRNDLLEYKDIIKHQYLATEDIQDNLIDFLEEKNISRTEINEKEYLALYDTLILDIEEKIVNLNKKLIKAKKELYVLYNS